MDAQKHSELEQLANRIYQAFMNLQSLGRQGQKLESELKHMVAKQLELQDQIEKLGDKPEQTQV